MAAATTSLEFNHQNQKLEEKNLSLLQVLFCRRNSSPILVNPLQQNHPNFHHDFWKKKVEILQAALSIIMIIISRLDSVACFRQSKKRSSHPDCC